MQRAKLWLLCPVVLKLNLSHRRRRCGLGVGANLFAFYQRRATPSIDVASREFTIPDDFVGAWV